MEGLNHTPQLLCSQIHLDIIYAKYYIEFAN